MSALTYNVQPHMQNDNKWDFKGTYIQVDMRD